MRRRGGRGPSYICSTLHEPRSVWGLYGFRGMCHIKVVHFGYSTYVWPTCKEMVVVLSHPLKRLSVISMLSIYGPTRSITTLPNNERGYFDLGGDYFFVCNTVYI
jgi:hypothetical protein